MKLMSKGDLYFHMSLKNLAVHAPAGSATTNNRKVFSEEITKRVLVEVIKFLGFLHRRKIIYRNLRP